MAEVIEIERLTKRYFSALEKVFAAEIEGRLPLQSKAKVYAELEKEGFVERYERRFCDRFGEMVFSGWCLTHAGRLTFCMNCEGEDDEA